VPAIKFDVANYLVHLEHRLEQSARNHGLEIRLSTEVTPDSLRGGDFGAVVCCTGSSPVMPPIEGNNARSVVLATDLLATPSLAKDARNIVMVGGGDVGCETAHMLAYEYGKAITVLEMSPYFMRASCAANRGYLIHYLERKGVALWNCSRVNRIEDGTVTVTRNVSPTVPSPYAVWEPVLPENVRNPFAREVKVEERTIELAADLVVFATGLTPNNGLHRTCMETRVAPEIHNIGDSFGIGRIFDATKAGYAVGSSL